MRLNTCVVFGGKSVEHEVSIITASQIMENINKMKYNPIPIYVTKDNELYYSEDMKNIDFFSDVNTKGKSKKVEFIKKGNKVSLFEVKNKKLKYLFEVDLVVLSVHGTNCEDGTLSAYFEFLDLPYVGSDTLSSSVSQNKVFTKVLLESENLPVIDYTYFTEHEFIYQKDQMIEKCERLNYPLIVKPVSLGSSIGVNKCDNQDELITAIQDAFNYDKTVLIEKAIINMKEFNCAVMGNETKSENSLIEEVLKNDKVLSYSDKYLSGEKTGKGIVSTKRKIPANLDDDLSKEIEQLAIAAFKTIGNSGISRIDFIYDMENNKVYINEINTIPGSLSYYLWDHDQMPYSLLLDKLIDIALKNYKSKENKVYTYDTNILSLVDTNLKSKLK